MDKSGYKTSEFWVSLGPILGLLTEDGRKNQEMLIVAATFLCAVYIISRTCIKCKRNST